MRLGIVFSIRFKHHDSGLRNFSNILIITAVFCMGSSVFGPLAGAQTNEWTWMGGSSTIQQSTGDQPGVYGTQGVPAAGNIPGSRQNAATWVDSHGNFWLFGGVGADSATGFGLLNDLWEFDPTTLKWAWQGGSNSVPGTCCKNGHPGVYGVLGTFAGANIPGSRSSAASWTDTAGNLWLYGGSGLDSAGSDGPLNDLWEFNPATLQWAWMGGSNTVGSGGQPPVYGTLGTAAAGNNPGGLSSSTTWTDQNGNFWLFGGWTAIDPTTSYGVRSNDLWEFNPSLREWAWMGGSTTIICRNTLPCRPGVYGTLGVASAGNIPGGRSGATGWVDSAGHLWLFGGVGSDSVQQQGYLNDLWEYDISSKQWMWMAGSSTEPPTTDTSPGQPGVYGTLGVAAAANTPGARANASTWSDGNGTLWMFGGSFCSAVCVPIFYNDLWAFSPTSLQWTWMGGNNTLPPFVQNLSGDGFAGVYGALGMPAAANIAGSRANASIWLQADHTLWLFGGSGADSTGATGFPADLWRWGLPPAASPTFSVPSGTYTSAQSVTISDSTPGAKIYFTTDGSTPTTNSTLFSGPISVSVSETINSIAVANGYSSSEMISQVYNLPVTFSLAATPATLTVKAGGTGTLNLTVTPQNQFNSTVTFACSGLPSGVTCGFSPSSVTPAGGNSATTQLILTASATASVKRLNPGPLFPVLALASLIAFRVRRKSILSFLLLLLLSFAFISACGSSGSGGNSGPPPVNATITVAATSGSIQQTTTIGLTVN
ncbi:hypothetical protein DYQ86_07505 [Acidobacteria bacterium AB60]|nr:hypothetical protein DYQ86_07505 [Acidobacteria bacterium AB60]